MKQNPQTENIPPIVTDETTPSQLASRNKEIMKTNEKPLQDQNLLKPHLCTRALVLREKKKKKSKSEQN